MSEKDQTKGKPKGGDYVQHPEGKGTKTRGYHWDAELKKLKPMLDDGIERDKNYNHSNAARDEATWVKRLAVHLAAEPAFAKFMQNAQDLDSIILTKDWLAAVYLPGRYGSPGRERYQDAPAWHKSWFSVKGNRMAILTMARNIFEKYAVIEQTTIKDTQVQTPAPSVELKAHHEELFRLHATRLKLVELIKSCTDTEYALVTHSKELTQRYEADTPSSKVLASREEWEELVECKEEAREKLRGSSLNEEGLKLLEELLETVPADANHGKLYSLPDDSKFDIVEPAVSGDDDPEHSDNADQATSSDEVPSPPSDMPEREGVPIDFLGGRFLGMDQPAVFTCRTPQPKTTSKEQEKVSEMNEAILDGVKYDKVDKRCAKWLVDLKAQVDKKHFALTFRTFEAVVERPEEARKVKNKRGLLNNFWINPRRWLPAAQDNIMHVRRLVTALLDLDLMIYSESDEGIAEVQSCLRRMWALLALGFGCWPEPALLCTLVDALLEQFAEYVIGHKDPKYETVRMRVASELLKRPASSGERPPLSTDPKLLEREHKARMMFAELACFYRGAIMMAVAAVQPKIGDKNKKAQKEWYESLIRFNSTCGNRTCAEQLKVEFDGDKKQNKWSISIAVKDARIGFPEERSFISSDRLSAYTCFYNFIVAVRYNDGLGIFFHYFAHLWHPSCRPFRGKQTLLDDIALMEVQNPEQEEPQEIADFTDDSEEMLLT